MNHYSRGTWLIVACSFAITACVPARLRPNHASYAAPCRLVDIATVEHLRYLRERAHRTDTSDVSFRRLVGVPFVQDTNQIAVVADSAICARAASAFNTIVELEDSTVTEIEVIRVDSIYVVSHPMVASGEWVARYVFNRNFEFIEAYLNFSTPPSELTPSGRPRAPRIPCAESSFAATQSLSSYAKLLARTDTASIRVQTAFGLRAVSASEVRMEKSPWVCDRAAVAYAHILASAGKPPAPVWVIRAGPHRFIVFNYAFRGESGFVTVVFDETFTSQALIAQSL
jgi:hypothetical protein